MNNMLSYVQDCEVAVITLDDGVARHEKERVRVACLHREAS